jgi:steroid 5-alpha reductase family enzyme
MLTVWVLYRILKNPSIVDTAWALGLMISGLIYLCSAPFNFRIGIISSVLIIWGMRLGGYLWYTRIRKGIVDKRYLKLSENWKIAKSVGFLLNFQLQGFLILIISSVFLLAAHDSPSTLSLLDWAGVILALVAIAGETLADYQLYSFQQTNKGEVCQSGLWKYSRHPNYYFEWLIWWAFTLFALHFPLGWIAWVSPLLLYLLMTKVTGPLTERGSIAARGQAYLDYQRRTAMFFPWFRR